MGFRGSSVFNGFVIWVSLLAMLSSMLPLGSGSAPAASAAGFEVQMKDLKFAPAALTVPAGSTVVWTNFDKPSHNIAIDRGPEIFVSPEQKLGQTSRFTFTRPGTYHYFCEFHPFMQATVVVTDPKGGGVAAPASETASRAFAETGKTVRGAFLDYWNAHGDLAQQGFPISEEMQEKSDTDGKVYTVQYFERAVFESHPENAAPNDVLLSLLGTFNYKQKYPKGAPNHTPITGMGSQLFKETNHRVGGRFLEYWQKNGGLAQQGFPISDEFMEKNDLDGKTYRVQYFERAVFEYHPENKPPYDVLLSQLGTFRYRAESASAPKSTNDIYATGV